MNKIKFTSKLGSSAVIKHSQSYRNKYQHLSQQLPMIVQIYERLKLKITWCNKLTQTNKKCSHIGTSKPNADMMGII